MNLEQHLRAKAMAQGSPITWAATELARCVRLLEQTAPLLPYNTVEERSLRMAVEFLLLDLKLPVEESA